MKCTEVKEVFAAYWDLSEEDALQEMVNAHINHCLSCAEEFKIWEESSSLIHDSSMPVITSTNINNKISSQVMARIYSDESWRTPIPDRIYSITYKLRRNLTGIIAFCLALFTLSLVYSILYQAPNVTTFDVNVPVAVAMADTSQELDYSNKMLQGVPVASISDPFTLKIGPIKTYPDYLVVVSLLGIMIALLIMNWFSRIKT